MFKAYIVTSSKKPIRSVRNKENWITLETAKGHREFGGILADDLIMIDIDEPERAEILNKIIDDLGLKCHKLRTDRGRHFYFRNTEIKTNKIGTILACGLEADIKLGSKNTVVPLKIDGIERELIEVSVPDKLPKWLEPINKSLNFYLMGEGDGRNQSLFNYILTLQAEGFTKDEVKETIEIINKYVLKQGLDERELEVILRDDAFQKPVFFVKGKLQIEVLVKYLINNYNIKKIGNMPHIYIDGIYTNNELEINRVINKELPSVTKSMAGEIRWKIELLAPSVSLSASTHVVLKNGLYNLKTGNLEDFTPDYIAKNKLRTKYNSEAYSKEVDNMLNMVTCNNKELRQLLEEVVGYTLFRRNELGKAFILTGHGSNGKSTFLNVLRALIGEENISSLSLQELGQRFKTAELFGKLVNIGDDIPNNYIKDNSVFKKLTTGETMNVERKGTDPFDFRNYAKLFFSANELPQINDTSYGLMRRLVIIPFNANLKKSESYDPYIIDKLTKPEALEYLLLLAIEGLKRVLNNHAFTEVIEVNRAIDEYNLINNPVLQFIQEGKIENELVPDVYRAYSVWCLDNGYESVTKNILNKEIKKAGYETKKGWVPGLGKVATIYKFKK